MDVIKTNEIQHPVIYEDEVITVYGELQSFGLQLHAYVHKWNHKTVQHIFNVTLDIAVNSKEPVFAFAYNSKLKKFCEMFGFVSIDTVFNTDGKVIGELMMIPNTGEDYV
jgi:hypothetical protein